MGELFTVGQKGSIVGSLDKACGGRDNRYLVLFWLFPEKWPHPSEVSTKILTNSEWWALYRWLRPYKDEHEDRWIYDQNVNEEVRWIMDQIEQEHALPTEEPTSEPKTSEKHAESRGEAVG